MSLTIGFDQLLDYSAAERRKWRGWFEADPARFDIPVQPGARFPNAWALVDHMFFAERRHLARLEGGTPPDATGVPAGDWKRLFEYGDLVRADLRRYAADLDDAAGSQSISFTAIGVGPMSMSRRRLLVHVFVHEVRHLAQLALAARAAGVEPPGEHDVLFFAELT